MTDAERIRELEKQVEGLAAERDKLQRFIDARGYRHCDIPACNCNSWHGGHAETRLHEIYEALGELVQGKTALDAVRSIMEERERLSGGAQIRTLESACNEALFHLRDDHITALGKRRIELAVEQLEGAIKHD